MNRTSRPLIGLILLSVVTGVSAEAPPPKYPVGAAVGEVALTDLAGKPVKLTKYAGKTVALVFLASFSKTAKEVGKDVEKRLKPKLPAKAVVVYVHTESKVAAETFRKEQSLTGEALLDPKAEFLVALGHKSVPAVAVVDGAGVLRFTASSFNRAKVEAEVKQVTGDGA